MFAFGETVERTPKDFAADRARIKKGKVLGTRQPVELIQTKESLFLPNITTTQLTQNCKTSCEEREVINGQERKNIQQIAKPGRLRDSTYMFEEIGSKCVKDLEGLFISKLNFQSGNVDDSCELFSSSSENNQRTKRSLSKTDSGFCEDSTDETATPLVDSANESDKASNTSNSSRSGGTLLDQTTSDLVSRSEKIRRITMDFKTILNRGNKTVVRNTDRLTARANMCIQSQQSLHADLVAFKNFTTHHNGEISNCTLQTNEHCVKLREVILKTRRNSLQGEAVKQSDTSLAVLKNKRRLLGKRCSAGSPFSFTEPRVNKGRTIDMSRATCNCEQRRVQFSDLERLHLNRQCASCPVDFVASQQLQDRITPRNSENLADLSCAVSTSGLTEKALLETSQSQETVDVNVKCQEWLNRWLLFNNSPQTTEGSTAVTQTVVN